MKRQTEEWINKAEGDRRVALREMQTGEPVYEAVVELVRSGWKRRGVCGRLEQRR